MAFINDEDGDVVARNVILLLSAFCFDARSAPEVLLHLWYSALIPEWIFTGLREVSVPPEGSL